MLALNMSGDDAQKIIHLPPETALISISDNKNEFTPLQVSGENVVQLKFDDVRGSEARFHNGDWYRPMSLNQAHELINFIDQRPDFNYYIHCQAGISRSAAVAMYLHIIYGHKLKPNFYLTSDANPYILGLLINEKLRMDYGR